MVEKKIKELTIQDCRKICKKYGLCEKCPLALLDNEKYRYCGFQYAFHLSEDALNKKVKI